MQTLKTLAASLRGAISKAENAARAANEFAVMSGEGACYPPHYLAEEKAALAAAEAELKRAEAQPAPEAPRSDTPAHPKIGERWSVNIAKDGHKPIISVLTVTMTDEDGNLYAGYPDGGGSVIVPRENFTKKVRDAALAALEGK